MGFWVGSVALLGACGGGTDSVSGASQAATPTTQWDTLGNLFTTEFSRCSSCHAPGKSQAAGPDMSTPATFHRDVVGKKASDYPNWNVGSTCSQSVNFITAGSSLNSTLAATLDQGNSDTLSASKNCITSFSIHKANGAVLSSNGISNVDSWIRKGALNN
ncbi:MAG: hypothetical protein Q9N68_00265 [Gammaproteobacteria bacterium]|nr:hypothetical protein [Gammaproteobacteria bacterium]